MPKMTTYSEYDGLGLAELVAKKAVTPGELVEAAIERIEDHNPTLNAVVHKGYDDARRWATGPLPDGPFKGVPFLIKDLGAQVKGWPRTSGSLFAQVGLSGAPLSVQTDRIMLCGGMAMIKDIARLLDARGFIEGSNAKPGDYVIERAFVG